MIFDFFRRTSGIGRRDNRALGSDLYSVLQPIYSQRLPQRDLKQTHGTPLPPLHCLGVEDLLHQKELATSFIHHSLSQGCRGVLHYIPGSRGPLGSSSPYSIDLTKHNRLEREGNSFKEASTLSHHVLHCTALHLVRPRLHGNTVSASFFATLFLTFPPFPPLQVQDSMPRFSALPARRTHTNAATTDQRS
jgi:hypothetical protein